MFQATVIVPAYNAAETLRETIESILAQTCPAHGVIVVDDGSTDDTAKIAKGYPGIEVILQENCGVPTAFNVALSQASGSHLAFLDADDVWTPDCLAVHRDAFADASGLDASIGDVEEFVCPTLDAVTASRFIARERQPGWLSGATVVSVELAKKVGAFDPTLRLGAWIDWFGRAKAMSPRIAINGKLVLKRRLKPGTLSGNPAAVRAANLRLARLALQRKRLASP